MHFTILNIGKQNTKIWYKPYRLTRNNKIYTLVQNMYKYNAKKINTRRLDNKIVVGYKGIHER